MRHIRCAGESSSTSCLNKRGFLSRGNIGRGGGCDLQPVSIPDMLTAVGGELPPVSRPHPTSSLLPSLPYHPGTTTHVSLV
eukprot:3341673-Rhodomonas_salina.1